MMTLLLFTACFGNQAMDAYQQKDVTQLVSLYEQAVTREDSLLALYRLYPLVEDPDLIADIPATLKDGSGREMALLSALWAFRMGDGSVVSKMKYAGRWYDLLQRARAASPDDAFVRLVYAQSVYHMPSFIGGGKKRAIGFFSRLRDQLAQDPQCGVSTLELDVWICYALDEAGDPEADSMMAELLASDLPPLFREVLEPTS